MSTATLPALTVSEVATLMSVSETTVTQWILKKQLVAMDISNGAKNKHWRIEQADLEEFKRARKGIVAPDTPKPTEFKKAKKRYVKR